jgi:D-3-phosphoglycerate dehydrogenase
MVKGKVKRLVVNCQGEITNRDLSPLTTGAMRGVLSVFMPDMVNYVNAPVMAKMQGLQVESSVSTEMTGYKNLVTVTLETDEAPLIVSGTVFEGQNIPRIVMVNDYDVEAFPEGNLLVLENKDHIGVVGLVGTILAKNGVNINGMSLGTSRTRPVALEIIKVEQPVPQVAVDELKSLDDILMVKGMKIQ